MNELTIPSRSLEVWRRLYTRYRLEPHPASVSPDVSKTIQPVTQADKLLTRVAVRSNTKEIPTGVLTEVLTVPSGERWTLLIYDVVRVDGDRVLGGIGLTDPVNGLAMFISRPANTTAETVIMPTPVDLPESWQIGVQVGGGATDGDWITEVLVDIQDEF